MPRKVDKLSCATFNLTSFNNFQRIVSQKFRFEYRKIVNFSNIPLNLYNFQSFRGAEDHGFGIALSMDTKIRRKLDRSAFRRGKLDFRIAYSKDVNENSNNHCPFLEKPQNRRGTDSRVTGHDNYLANKRTMGVDSPRIDAQCVRHGRISPVATRM